MSVTNVEEARTLGLRPGELVRVRPADEIMQTLDEDGKLDQLPFMPEMLSYCGRSMRVSMRADKTCDGMGTVRWMDDVVHLAGARCDGSAHDGCQAACRIYWKEAWLTRVDTGDRVAMTKPIDTAAAKHHQRVATRTLLPLAKIEHAGETLYRCQATEVMDATRPLPPWQLQQYRVDLANWNAVKLVKNLVITGFNKLQDASRKYVPASLQVRGGHRFPFVIGTLKKTPKRTLDLRPGDVVRVKSKEQIIATLDVNNKNRGLMFDGEMLRYCGQIGRVRDRIEKIIDEHTGRMIELESDCVTLEDVVCKAEYHRLCSRGIYQYWREIWLERVD